MTLTMKPLLLCSLPGSNSELKQAFETLMVESDGFTELSLPVIIDH